MAERTDALNSNAYKDAVADISEAIHNPALWDEVNSALQRGIANGNISYDGLEKILPQVGISGDLIASEFTRLNSNTGNDGLLTGVQISEAELSEAATYGDKPLTALAAQLALNDREKIRSMDWWRDQGLFGLGEDNLDIDEINKYRTDVRTHATENLRGFLDGRDGVVTDEHSDADGDGDDEDDDDDDREHDGECSYDEDCDEDEDERDSDDDDDEDEEDEIAEEARVNDDYFDDLDVDDLKRYLAKDSKDPADRLRAAWELAERGEKVVTLKNGDDELTIEISTDENGYISLWTQGVNGPLMKGVVKENQVVTQDGNYFGKSWRGAHGEELFDDD